MTASERRRFEADLQAEGTGTYVIVPGIVAESWGVRGRTSVRGTVNGYAFRNQVMPYRDDSPARRRWYMVVNRQLREEIGAKAGDRVIVEIEPDLEPRTAEVPVELAEALDADEDIRAAFERLPPSHRREYAQWVGEAKLAETRRRRAVRTVTRILDADTPGS
jgi:hypothetical protein